MKTGDKINMEDFYKGLTVPALTLPLLLQMTQMDPQDETEVTLVKTEQVESYTTRSQKDSTPRILW